LAKGRWQCGRTPTNKRELKQRHKPRRAAPTRHAAGYGRIIQPEWPVASGYYPGSIEV
jgi:hypothetical protein